MKKRATKKKNAHLMVDCVDARSIRLVDESGNPRILMDASSQSSVIQLLGDDGLPRIELYMHGDNSTVRLYGPGDIIGCSISVNDRSNGIAVNDTDGLSVISCGVYHDRHATPIGLQPMIIVTNNESGRQWTVPDLVQLGAQGSRDGDK